MCIWYQNRSLLSKITFAVRQRLFFMSAGKNSTVLLRTARHCRYEQAADQNEQTACILCLQRRSVTALYRDIQPCEGAGAPPYRPDVPLRGGRRPTRQSREGSYGFAGAFVISDMVLRDCHVASLLAMTNLEASHHTMRAANTACLQGAQ